VNLTFNDVANASKLISSESPKLGAHVYLNNDDAKLKYSYLLIESGKLGLNKDSLVLEVGAGDGHISRLLARKYGCKVEAVDIVRRRYVLDRPPRLSGFPRRFVGNLRRWIWALNKVHYIVGNCSEFLRSQQTEKYDLIIDGCSVIHFHETSVSNQNDYLTNLMLDYSNIHRILKESGTFITATDIAATSSSSEPSVFLLTEDEMKGVLTKVGFELISTDESKSETVPGQEFVMDILNHPYLRVKLNSEKRPYLVGVSGLTARKS
jgi:SAM-dependent methyltransferase